MTSALVRWIRCIWLELRRRGSYGHVLVVNSMDEVPKHPGGTVYLVSRGDIPRWAVVSCPCRCGENIQVNLMKSVQPHWDLEHRDGKLTLRPSLWRSAETCGSHFFVEKNRVRWV